MYNPAAAMKGVKETIMSAQTVDETVSTVMVVNGILNHVFSIRTSAAVTGAVQLESAPSADYTGVWSPLGGGPIDLSTIPTGALDVSIQGLYNAVRARISAVVAGGNVSVDYMGF